MRFTFSLQALTRTQFAFALGTSTLLGCTLLGCGAKPPPPTKTADVTAAAAPAGKEERFGVPFHFVAGDRVTYTATMEARGKLVIVDGSEERSGEAIYRAASRRAEQIVSVGDHGPSKVRVTFLAKGDGLMFMGNPKERQSALSGNTYVVHARDGGIAVERAEGSGSFSEREGRLLAKMYANLGQKSYLMEAVPTGTFRKGDVIPTLGEALRRTVTPLDSEGAAIEVKDAKVTFAEIRTTEAGPVAVFKASVTMRHVLGAIEATPTLRGTLSLQLDTARFLELSLTGKGKAEPAPSKNPRATPMEVKGELEYALKEAASYL